MSCIMDCTVSDKYNEYPSSQEAYKFQFDYEHFDNDLSLNMSVDV